MFASTRVYGEMIHPAYAGLNGLGVTDANSYYEDFNSRDKSTEVLEKYLKKLDTPKNFWDKFIFYGTFFDSRITKKAAVQRILHERTQKNLEKQATEAMNSGASHFSG